MNNHEPLPAEELRRCCSPDDFSFNTTDDLEDLGRIIGQTRALEAMRFGISIPNPGYNLYVLGPSGLGKLTAVKSFLEERAKDGEVPPDWCYVNNFEDPTRPRTLKLPPGRGAVLGQDMRELTEKLGIIIPAAFEGEPYQTRVEKINEEFKGREQNAFRELQESAANKGIQVVPTPSGFAFAPIHEGKVVSPEEFGKLPEPERERISGTVGELQKQLESIMKQVPRWREESRKKIKKLNDEVAGYEIGHLIDELRGKYRDLPAVEEYLEALGQDIVSNVDDFRPKSEAPVLPFALKEEPSLRNYEVNVLVDNGETRGVPVVFEDNPTYPNLVGRLEHMAKLGALVTDFTLLKPGALHRANGGYLILDARKLLLNPYAWEGLKRALYAKEIQTESLGQAMSMVSTVALEPEKIPLDAKIVLLGDRMLYYMLQERDPDFGELFKVAADFEESFARTGENDLLYARVIATLVRKQGLKPFDRSAVGAVLEQSMRISGDTQKLSMHMRSIENLLEEASFWATEEGRDTVTAEDVQTALRSQIERVDRVRDLVHESIQREMLRIETTGEAVGQINGLTYLQIGNFAFGRPVRISASTRLGAGRLIDIEREVDLGGPIHSKGVFILSSFLGTRYARDVPLSLSASLVFEQSYGRVDGDSASCAELCALLSSLSGVPIRQSLAITGSVDQQGRVQAIGGVNEKIEGFFDVCRERGLTGEQGCIIPAANVDQMMLRSDVVEAAAEGRFRVYAVKTADEALELLTGVSAGEADAGGNFPEDSVNGRVDARLRELSRLRKSFGRPEKPGKEEDAPDDASTEGAELEEDQTS